MFSIAYLCRWLNCYSRLSLRSYIYTQFFKYYYKSLTKGVSNFKIIFPQQPTIEDGRNLRLRVLPEVKSGSKFDKVLSLKKKLLIELMAQKIRASSQEMCRAGSHRFEPQPTRICLSVPFILYCITSRTVIRRVKDERTAVFLFTI